MTTTQSFKLIDGTFSTRDATELLLSLVKSKIDFHNLEKLSSVERFGRDTAHSERRLAELRQLHDTLRVVCQTAADNNERMQLSGWIEITLLPGQAAASDR